MESQDAEQFESSSGEHIEIVDRTPREPKSVIPVLIAPGWGETPKVLEDVIEEVVKADRRAIALKYVGAKGSRFEKTPLAVEIAEAEALLEFLDNKGVDKIDSIAHSSGAISIAIAASINPEKFRNIIFVDPAGMIGNDTFPRLLGRFSKKVIHDTYQALKNQNKRKPALRLLKEGGKFIIQHPVQGLKEAVAISRSDIYDMVQELRRSGIKIGVMAGIEDAVFPMELVQNRVKAGTVDGFLSLKGGHDELHYQRRYAKAAEGLLTSLEQISPL